jgi:hypothetical protein
MNRVRKIIFIISISFLGLLILFPVIRASTGLEFASDTVESSYHEFIFFAVPIAILFTLFGTLKIKDGIGSVIAVILCTIIGAFLSLFIMVLSIFLNMCNYYDVKILYQHKDSPSKQIVIREFGCGATDSGPPFINVNQIEYFTPYFIHSTKIDTNEMNKSDWIRYAE